MRLELTNELLSVFCLEIVFIIHVFINVVLIVVEISRCDCPYKSIDRIVYSFNFRKYHATRPPLAILDLFFHFSIV